MTDYVPAEYWGKRGETWEAEAIAGGWDDAENPPLFRLLDTLEFDSVLEVGCGFGRVAAAMKRHYPHLEYFGIDISWDLVQAAARRVPDALFLPSDVAVLELPPAQYDLVLAVSTLGHILPADIEKVINKMRAWARKDVVAIDWDAPGESTSFQFGHDYRKLYGGALRYEEPYGRQTLFHVAPLVEPWQEAFG